MKFGMENDNLSNNVDLNNNEKITDMANASSGTDCVNKNYDKLLSEAQIQGYLMSKKVISPMSRCIY